MTTPKASWSVILHPQDTGAEGSLEPGLQPPGVGGGGGQSSGSSLEAAPRDPAPHGAGSVQGSGEGGALQLRVAGTVLLEDGCIPVSPLILVSSVALLACLFKLNSSVSGSLQPLLGCSPPGACVHGVLQARILEGVAISSSTVSSRPGD